MGIIPGVGYTVGQARLERGDILFGYTDGVTEARSPADTLYSRRRLENSVAKAVPATAGDFLDRIRSDLFRFIRQAPQSDDITMLALRWDDRAD